MIWDALKHYAQEERHGDFVLKTMDSLLNLFCIKYTTACCKRRRYMLYFAVGLLTDAVPSTVEIISKDHKLVLISVLEQISVIYKQIKKNEISPNTDYLFSNLEKHNAMENTLKRLEMLDSMGSFPKRIEQQREDDDDDVYK